VITSEQQTRQIHQSIITEDMDTFHNRLCILNSLRWIDLANGGVIAPDDAAAWLVFSEDRLSWTIDCSDERFEALWSLITSLEIN